MEENQEHSSRPNRKRKKSFLTLAKKGKIDKGSSIPQEDYDYFLSILKDVNIGISSTEIEISILANNVLDQIQGKEADFLKNQLASRVIDNVIPFSSRENFERIATVISSDFRVYIDDQFASYIIQTILKTCLYRNLQKLEHSPDTFAKPNTSRQITFNLTETFEDDHIAFCNDFLTKTSKFLLNNMEEYVFESYGNFIIRTCLCCLVGIGVVITKTPAASTPASLSLDVSDLVKMCEAPASWKEIFFEYVSRLNMWPHWKDFPFESKTSGLLQIIIKCLSEEKAKKQITKLCKPFFTKKVVEDDDKKECKMSEDLLVENHEIFSNQASLHFLEGVLAAAGSKLSLHIYLNLFAGNLKALSCDKIANFSVQRLMEHCQDKNLFELIFDEIVEHIEDLICIGYTGVVIEIAKGCNRLATKQGQFVQALQSALHCTGANSHKLLYPILKLTPIDIIEKEEKISNFIHPHGSMILQQMLHFNKPIKLITNLLELKKEDLIQILSDKKGSFIADAFCASTFVGEKSRDRLIKHLADYYLPLALSQFGSRTLEQLYNVGNLGHKMMIVEELSKKLNQLNSSKFGRIINSKLCVFAYARGGEQPWKTALNSVNKVDQLFKEIVPTKL